MAHLRKYIPVIVVLVVMLTASYSSNAQTTEGTMQFVSDSMRPAEINNGTVYTMTAGNDTMDAIENLEVMGHYEKDGSNYVLKDYIPLVDEQGNSPTVESDYEEQNLWYEHYAGGEFTALLVPQERDYGDREYYLARFNLDGELIAISDELDISLPDDLSGNDKHIHVIYENGRILQYNRDDFTFSREFGILNGIRNPVDSVITPQGVWSVFDEDHTQSSFGRSNTEPGFFVLSDLKTGNAVKKLEVNPDNGVDIESVSYDDNMLYVFYDDGNILKFDPSSAVTTTNPSPVSLYFLAPFVIYPLLRSNNE